MNDFLLNDLSYQHNYFQSDKKRLNELLCLTEENDEMIRQEKREEKELIDMNCKISDMNYRLRIIQVKLKQRKQIIMEAMRENAKLKIGIRLERDEIDKIRKSFPNFGKQSNIGTRINNVENRVNGKYREFAIICT